MDVARVIVVVRVAFHSCDNVLKVMEESIHFPDVGGKMTE